MLVVDDVVPESFVPTDVVLDSQAAVLGDTICTEIIPGGCVAETDSLMRLCSSLPETLKDIIMDTRDISGDEFRVTIQKRKRLQLCAWLLHFVPALQQFEDDGLTKAECIKELCSIRSQYMC